MPYPIVLALAAAASAAGTGLQMAGAEQSRRSMQKAQDAETARQKQYQQRAEATFQQSLKKSTPEAAANTMTQAATNRTGAYDRLAVNSVNLAPAGAQPVTGSMGAAQRTATATNAAGNAWSRLVGGAQARLGAQDDWGLDQAIKNSRTREDLAITGSQSRASANLLGNEMNIAAHKGDGLNAWGQLAGALGSLAGAYAATTPVKPVNP